MKSIFRLLDDGGFVAGDEHSGMTSYAYPSSPHAIVAKTYPKHVAEEMLEAERIWHRKIPAIQEYDAKNWKILPHEHSYECIDASGRCTLTGEVAA